MRYVNPRETTGDISKTSCGARSLVSAHGIYPRLGCAAATNQTTRRANKIGMTTFRLLPFYAANGRMKKPLVGTVTSYRFVSRENRAKC